MVILINKILQYLKLAQKQNLQRELDNLFSGLINQKYKVDPHNHRDLAAALEIYKTYYNQIFAVPQQRLTLHSIFLTVNTILSSLVGYVMINQFHTWSGWPPIQKLGFLLIPYLLILSFCYIWFRLLVEYDELISSFVVLIKCMEENLPIKPLTMFLEVTYELGISSGPIRLTRALPIFFAVIYLTMFIYMFTS